MQKKIPTGRRLGCYITLGTALLTSGCSTLPRQAESGLAPSIMLQPQARPDSALQLDAHGWVHGIRNEPSPNFSARTASTAVTMLVIHNISLPPGQYGGNAIIRLLSGQLTPEDVPYEPSLARLRVSAHFLIRRDGQLLQFVSTEHRAMHAGSAIWNGDRSVNNRSIGIELEGSNFEPFEDVQYETLARLTRLLQARYPITDIVGHADVAPARKADPGPYFDWPRYKTMVEPTDRLAISAAQGDDA